MIISVILCTHNPREEYLSRTLAALQEQTLADGMWELVIVDNASENPIRNRVDLSLFRNGRVIEESALGLTNARLRGIEETTGELLVFVDDDNVLAPNYLEVAAKIASEHLKLGAWSGQSIGEFEAPPSREVVVRQHYLALMSLPSDIWGNNLKSIPFGAGMCVRRVVAEKYKGNVAIDKRRRVLGRIGANLSSAEDTDMALTSLDLGLGMGFFAGLKLTHLIPASRTKPEYLKRLVESSAYSKTMLNLIRGGESKKKTRTLKRKIFDSLVTFYQRWLIEPVQRDYLRDVRRGEAKAQTDFIRTLKSESERAKFSADSDGCK